MQTCDGVGKRPLRRYARKCSEQDYVVFEPLPQSVPGRVVPLIEHAFPFPVCPSVYCRKQDHAGAVDVREYDGVDIAPIPASLRGPGRGHNQVQRIRPTYNRFCRWAMFLREVGRDVKLSNALCRQVS